MTSKTFSKIDKISFQNELQNLLYSPIVYFHGKCEPYTWTGRAAKVYRLPKFETVYTYTCSHSEPLKARCIAVNKKSNAQTDGQTDTHVPHYQPVIPIIVSIIRYKFTTCLIFAAVGEPACEGYRGPGKPLYANFPSRQHAHSHKPNLDAEECGQEASC